MINNKQNYEVQNKLTKEKIIEVLKKIDFNKTTKIEVARKLEISVRTVDNYIQLYNIPYKKRNIGVLQIKDKNGRYDFHKNNEYYRTVDVKPEHSSSIRPVSIKKKVTFNNLNSYDEKIKKIKEEIN